MSEASIEALHLRADSESFLGSTDCVSWPAARSSGYLAPTERQVHHHPHVCGCSPRRLVKRAWRLRREIRTRVSQASIGYMSQKFSLYLDCRCGPTSSSLAGLWTFRAGLRGRADEVLRLCDLEQDATPSRVRFRAVSAAPGLGCAILHRPAGAVSRRAHGRRDPSAAATFGVSFAASPAKAHHLRHTHYLDEAEVLRPHWSHVDGRLVALDTPDALKKRYVPDRCWRYAAATCRSRGLLARPPGSSRSSPLRRLAPASGIHQWNADLVAAATDQRRCASRGSRTRRADAGRRVFGRRRPAAERARHDQAGALSGSRGRHGFQGGHAHSSRSTHPVHGSGHARGHASHLRLRRQLRHDTFPWCPRWDRSTSSRALVRACSAGHEFTVAATATRPRPAHDSPGPAWPRCHSRRLSTRACRRPRRRGPAHRRRC